MKNYFKLKHCSLKFLAFFLLLPCLFCVSCSNIFDTTYFKKYPLMTENDYKATQLLMNLQEAGIQTFLSGNYISNGTIRLLIVGNSLFNKDSANFNDQAFKILDKIVLLLNLYDEEVIKVHGGVGIANSNDIYRKSLALARAHQVVRYLWSQDINATFIYVDDKSTPTDFIEITFKKYKQF